MSDADVLVVGAGPVGLTAALALVLADVEGARHVAVGHQPRQLDLAAEAVQHVAGPQKLRPQQLQRDDLVQLDRKSVV